MNENKQGTAGTVGSNLTQAVPEGFTEGDIEWAAVAICELFCCDISGPCYDGNGCHGWTIWMDAANLAITEAMSAKAVRETTAVAESPQ